MSTQQLSDDIDELFDLVRKSDGIISTFEARDLETEPESVENAYSRYAETHISLGDTSGFEDDVYESVVEGDKPTKGYLYGPFGYGKTSTSVSVWHTLSDNDIIAVPPFSVTSFAGVMRATYGWMRYELEQKAPGYVDDLEAINDQYLQQELKAFAEEQEDNYDLDFDQLVEMFGDMERDNQLDLSINADTLIDFFSECTKLALEAEFDGLVVLGDELQQYFKKADNRQEAESRFRDLVFALHSGAQVQSEFGLFLSMPEQTKSTLDTQAGDVLNRLQKNNLVLNLRNVYGQQFPAELWDRYATQFSFANQKHEVIDEATLDAIGQISSRDDLSNGPRTVIDLFRLAISHYRNTDEVFTPLALADCFYEGDVRYQGSTTKIQSAIGDALDHSSVNTTKREQFIKMCAVFPQEGIPDSVVDEYGLETAREELSKKIHGEIIKVIADGYTLIDVTRRDGPGDIVQELIRDFWSQYDYGHVNAGYAMDALANSLLCGEIFEVKKGELRGWPYGDGLHQIQGTVYEDRLEGTFNTKFPKRVMNVAVADAENQDEVVGDHPSLGGTYGDPDLAFNFVLGWAESGDGRVDPHIRKESDREYTFVLDGREGYEELPSGLDFLRDAMDPNAVTPFLMLALVRFLDEDDTELDAQQESRVESFQNSLLEQTLKALFDKELINSAPYDLSRAGKRAVESLFAEAMEEVYPDYRTLIGSNQYERIVSDYMDFLDSLDTTSQCRGSRSIQEPKSQVASRFGLSQTSTFDGRINKHYSDLLTVVNPDTDEYEVRAELHPLEEEIVDELESGEREAIPLAEIDERAYEKGYRQEEVELIYGILNHRRLVKKNEDDALVLRETEVSMEQVENAVEGCKELVDRIEALDADRVPADASQQLLELDAGLDEITPEDDEQLEQFYVFAQHLHDRLEQQAEVLHSQADATCKDIRKRAERKKRGLLPNRLEDPVEGGVKFVGSLDDARSAVVADFNEVKASLTQLVDEIDNAHNKHADPTIENAEALQTKADEKEGALEDITSQIDELEDRADKVKQWRTFTDRVSNVKRNIVDYSRTFDETIDEEEEIEEFIAQIAERLADEPENALDNLEAFSENLDHIQESYEQRQEQRRDRFDEKRESLKTILSDATDSATGLRTATYDIKKPDESRRQLLEDFKDGFRSQVIEQADEQLEAAHNEVEYARIVGVDAETDENPDRVAEKIEQARNQLQRLRGDLDRFDFAAIDKETNLSEDGRSVLEKAGSLRKTAQEFRRENDPDDDGVAELLSRVQEHRGVDFKELLMEYHEDGEDVSPEELLERMNRLFELNQIDIKITERRR